MIGVATQQSVQFGEALPVQVLQNFTRDSAVFDDDNLVSLARRLNEVPTDAGCINFPPPPNLREGSASRAGRNRDAKATNVVQYFHPYVTGETGGARVRSVMNLTVAMASVCVAGGLGVGLAGPANAADPHALGTYTFEAEDGESATWTVTPCADDTDQCVRVAETGNSKRAPWSANAY